MRLWRAHGLGNDYLVLEEGPALSPTLVRAVCDRHRGVGSDGILEPTDGPPDHVGVRIWNPDGSVAEKSGNGLRIFGRWLVERRGAGPSLRVHTGTDAVRMEVGAHDIAVDMGRATFGPVDERLDGFAHPVVTVSVGNPHCVVFRDDAVDLDALPWRAWGRALEVHPRFPRRTNVQVARVLGPGRVELRIWERGAGETSASGSSSCAVAAAAVHTGRVEAGTVRLVMAGGELEVHVGPDAAVRLVGPVEVVGIVEVDPRWLARAT